MSAAAFAVALDPQEARPLSSREIAKLLCGVIGSIMSHDPLVVQPIVESVITLLIADPNNLAHLDHAAGHETYDLGAHRPPTWGAALGATILSLRGWCKPLDIQNALRWVSHNLDQICSLGGDLGSVN